MKQIRKVFHVELREPIDGEKHFYFGSKMAIFQRFTPETIGTTYNTLRAAGSIKNKPYVTKWAIIREGELVTTGAGKEGEE